jgi:hypothetical protein
MPNFLRTPTFIVGLGGIGQKVTFLLADRFHNSRWGGVPPTVRIRAIDTAPPETYEIPISRHRHFTQLGQFDADEVIENLNSFPEIQKWWHYKLTAGFISDGAHAERSVGRLILFRDMAKLYSILRADFEAPLDVSLQDHLSEAGLGTVTKQPRVYLVGSLAGGTCSGMLIDMAFLIRMFLRESGYDPGGINLTAILGLPSVIEVASKDRTTSMARKRRLNSYGAIREIDFLLGGWSDSFKLDYPEPVHTFHPFPPLFNQIYFFSATKMGGYQFKQQMGILSRVSHFIFGQVGSETGDVVRWIHDNPAFNPDSERTLSDGLKAIYGAFGVEWLEVPHQHLLRSWCREHAQRLGKLIVEFEWGQEPRENLNQKFRELLITELQGYRRALDLVQLKTDGILNAPELSPLNHHLNAILEAKKKSDLGTALRELELALPSLLGPVRSAVSVTLEQSLEDDWLLTSIQDLIKDRGFRMGGSRRVLEEAATQLRTLSQPIGEMIEKIEDIVKVSSSLLGKVDNGLAMDWAKRRVYQSVLQVIRERLGHRSDRLAARMAACAEGITRLREQISDAVEIIKNITVKVAMAPKDTWLLNPEDIQRMIQDNPDEVARRGADEIANALSDELTLAALLSHDVVGLNKNLHYWIQAAMEKAIKSRINRPSGSIELIKQRMTRCEPMARIIATGAEVKNIMRREGDSVSLKIVLTGLEEQDRQALDKWAEQENEGQATQAYQVFSTGEDLRDDVVNLALGWPLWLFNEIKSLDQPFEEEKRSNNKAYQHAFILDKQIPGIRDHEVKPMGEQDAGQWFGIALALKDLDIKGSTVVFNEERFPYGGEVDENDIGKGIAEAFKRFRQKGMSWEYMKFIKAAKKTEGPQFRQRLEEGLEERQKRLEQARELKHISDDIYKSLSGWYQLAREYAQRIVSL